MQKRIAMAITTIVLGMAGTLIPQSNCAQGQARKAKLMPEPHYSKTHQASKTKNTRQAGVAQKNTTDEPITPDAFQQAATSERANESAAERDSVQHSGSQKPQNSSLIQKGLDHSRNSYYNKDLLKQPQPNNRERYLPSSSPQLGSQSNKPQADKPESEQEQLPQAGLINQSRTQELAIPEQEVSQQKLPLTPTANVKKKAANFAGRTTRRMLNRANSLIKL